MKTIVNKIFHFYSERVNRRQRLPSIEEAWNMPISAERSSRQQQQQQQQQQLQQQQQQQNAANAGFKYGPNPAGSVAAAPPPYPQGQTMPNKRFKVYKFDIIIYYY